MILEDAQLSALLDRLMGDLQATSARAVVVQFPEEPMLRKGLVVFEDGAIFYLGPEVGNADEGDRIVDARRTANLPLTNGAEPGVNHVMLPDGEYVEAPSSEFALDWGVYEIGAGLWMPWNGIRQQFETREFTDATRCRRRCNFLNAHPELQTIRRAPTWPTRQP